MKQLEPSEERDELIDQWGKATAAVFNAYLDAMPEEQRAGILEAVGTGAMALEIAGSVFPLTLNLSIRYHDQPDGLVIASFKGGDAHPGEAVKAN